MENPDRALFVDFIDGTTRWRMDFGSDADGGPIVLLQSAEDASGDDIGVAFTLEGGGGGYHLYELRYDPSAAPPSVGLFVDGIERVSDFTGIRKHSASDDESWLTRGGPAG